MYTVRLHTYVRVWSTREISNKFNKGITLTPRGKQQGRLIEIQEKRTNQNYRICACGTMEINGSKER